MLVLSDPSLLSIWSCLGITVAAFPFLLLSYPWNISKNSLQQFRAGNCGFRWFFSYVGALKHPFFSKQQSNPLNASFYDISGRSKPNPCEFTTKTSPPVARIFTLAPLEASLAIPFSSIRLLWRFPVTLIWPPSSNRIRKFTSALLLSIKWPTPSLWRCRLKTRPALRPLHRQWRSAHRSLTLQKMNWILQRFLVNESTTSVEKRKLIRTSSFRSIWMWCESFH